MLLLIFVRNMAYVSTVLIDLQIVLTFDPCVYLPYHSSTVRHIQSVKMNKSMCLVSSPTLNVCFTNIAKYRMF